MNAHPKVTVVTVCRNSEAYIEDCILSVMNQTYEHVEHIIVDGESTDGTLDIIRRYEGQYPMRWISEKDSGMYDAICKGFAMATGDIFAWLNSDDMYMPWACELAAVVMSKTGIQWCTGIPCHYSSRGVAHNIPRVTPTFPQRFIRRGYMDGRVATFLEQESMFWSRQLWERCGESIRSFQYAGDYHLWKAFARFEPLYTLDSVVSGFRIRPGQKSGDRAGYYAEVGKLDLPGKLLQKTRLIRLLLLLASLTAGKRRIRTRAYLI